MSKQMDELLENLSFQMKHKANTYSPLALAYIGDGVYEMYVRTYIISKGNAPVNKLHKATRDMVRASAQSKVYHVIESLLTEEEQQVLRRGRNAKSVSVPKNADVSEYRHATGLEALIGYLYIDGQIDRIQELIQKGINGLND
ncbi:MAG: Mini-ribonuclease 3 [Cellulosilyticaceae bacterium]